MKKNLVYIHNAYFSKINANKIQVHNMCNALSEVGFNVKLISTGNVRRPVAMKK